MACCHCKQHFSGEANAKNITITCEEVGNKASLILPENKPVVPGNVKKIKQSM